MIDPTYYTPGMAMSRRKDRARTPGLWVATKALPRTGGHAFYQRLNQVLDQHGFDAFVEAQCATFYAPIGRPSGRGPRNTDLPGQPGRRAVPRSSPLPVYRVPADYARFVLAQLGVCGYPRRAVGDALVRTVCSFSGKREAVPC